MIVKHIAWCFEVNEFIAWEIILDDGFVKYINDEKTPLLPFTGVIDRQGKEIYAGFIVQDDGGSVYEVIFSQEKGAFILKDHFNDSWFYMTEFENLKILGHIYQNEPPTCQQPAVKTAGM